MWRANRSLALFTVLLFAVTASAGVNVPDWVRQAAAQKLPTYSPETDAVVLLDDTTDTVLAPGVYLEQYRRVLKILRPDGRNKAYIGTWIGHDEKLNSIHGWAIDSAGHEFELKDKDFIITSNAYSELYSDVYHRVAMAPAAEPGTVVALEYEAKRKDYFNELQWQPQEDIPVHHAVLTVTLPTGWELKDWASGMDLPKSSTAGSNGWQWVKDDLPEIDDEPGRPATQALAARLTVGLFTATEQLTPDWTALAKWASTLFQGRRDASPEMVAKVQELTAGKTDFDGKVRAITRFMQKEVRYYGIEIGIGGYQPHLASEVFHVRYGDCKDKANLLSALLKLAGIHSDIVLIHTDRGVVRPEMPGNYFDHAIIAVELPEDVSSSGYPSSITAKSGKRYVIFDPTDAWREFGEIRSELQDSYALLVMKDGGELIHIPVLHPDDSRLVRSATLEISPDGAISGKVTEELTGDLAESLRGRTAESDQAQQLKGYERRISAWVKNATVEGLQFAGLKDIQEPLNVKYNLSADRYAQTMGSLMIVRPRVLGIRAFSLDRKPRKYPLVVGSTSLMKDDFVLELPPGYAVDDKPEPVSLDTPFASYKSHLEIDGNKLHYSREYVMKTLEIPASKMEDLRAFENKVAEDENAAVVLKRVQQAPGH